MPEISTAGIFQVAFIARQMEQTPRAFFQTTFEPIGRVCAARHARGELGLQGKWRTCAYHTYTTCGLRLANFGEPRMDYLNFKEICRDITNIFNNCKDIVSCLESVKSNSNLIIYVLATTIVFIVVAVYKYVKKQINNKKQDEKAKIEEIRKRCLEVIIDLYQVARFCEFDLSESTGVSSKLWVKKSRKSKWIKETSYRSDKNPFDSIKKDAENIKNAEVSELIDQGLQINNNLVSFRQELEADDTEINYGHASKAGFIRHEAKYLLSEYKKNLTEEQKSRIKSIQDAEFFPSISKLNRWFCKKYKPSEKHYEPDTQVQYPDNDLDDDK